MQKSFDNVSSQWCVSLACQWTPKHKNTHLWKTALCNDTNSTVGSITYVTTPQPGVDSTIADHLFVVYFKTCGRSKKAFQHEGKMGHFCERLKTEGSIRWFLKIYRGFLRTLTHTKQHCWSLKSKTRIWKCGEHEIFLCMKASTIVND